MPKCVPCLHPKVKDFIRVTFPRIADEMDGVQDCRSGVSVNLCGPGGNSATKAPSPRNLFMGTCLKELKGGPNAMKECSARWRGQKAKGGA